ncbi:MAG: HD domain-containing protein [Methanobrevibacter sp.]|nr:HD domain-containing protein [Methanobrevibacter sp.]
MEKVIKIIYKEVEKRCKVKTNAYGIGAWDHHIKLVYEIAIANCEKYNADCEIVALSALLHDIASVTNKEYEKNHHALGADIAEKLLKKHGVEMKKVEHVKKCIFNHRGSKPNEKTTNEEVCVADADAMAHFFSIPSLLKMAYVNKNMDIDEGALFVLNKLERSYEKLSNKGKEIVADKYIAVKKILDVQI